MSSDSISTLFKLLDENKLELIDKKNILESYKGTDWCKFIKYSDIKYNRISLINNDKYEIILICWKKGQSSGVHDHPENGCLVKLLQGKLKEEVYSYKEKLTKLSFSIISQNDIAFQKGNRGLHNIIALEDSVSLHIYSPPKYQPKFYI